MSRPRIRVVVADDDEAVREALEDLVRAQGDLHLVGTAQDHVELVTVVRRLRPDVVLMDVRMPGGIGWTTAGQIKAALPEVAVLAISAFDDPDVILATLAAGAAGYLVKGTSEQELLEAIHRAHRGQLSVSVSLATHCLRNIMRDLEQLRSVEGRLRRNEGTYHDLLDRAPAGLLLVGPGDRLRLANAEADRIFARPVNALIGQPASRLLPTWCRASFMAMLDQAHQEHVDMPKGVSNQLAGLRADGDEFPAVFEMRSLKLGDEYVVGVFVRDLSGSRDVETRYQRLIESSPEALLIIDAGRRIELVNAQTEQLFGYQREELLGRPLELILPGSWIDRYLPGGGSDTTAPGEPSLERSVAVVGRRHGGVEFPIEMRVSSLDSEQGDYVVALRDMTDQRRRELLLEQSFQELRDIDREHHLLLTHLVRAQEDERKRISVGIHDDTLQAITAASLRVQQLRRRLHDAGDLEVLDKLEETIQLSISRLRNLIFDLRPPASEEGGLAAALNTYLQQLRKSAPIEYEVESTLTSELPQDSQVIAYRIAQEALTNIWRHSEASEARVRLVEVNNGCLVIIEDNGKGYDPIEAERKRGHLGLTLMQERAQIAGGWCRIESAPGSGTLVQFWIPKTVDPADLEDAHPHLGGGAR